MKNYKYQVWHPGKYQVGFDKQPNTKKPSQVHCNVIWKKKLIRKKAMKISKDEKGLKDENVKKRRWWHAASLILVYHLSYILCMYTLSRYSPPAIRAAYTIYDLCTIYMTYHKENAIIHSI